MFRFVVPRRLWQLFSFFVFPIFEFSRQNLVSTGRRGDNDVKICSGAVESVEKSSGGVVHAVAERHQR